MNGLEIPPSLVDSKINAPEHEEVETTEDRCEGEDEEDED
ncbi:hypothetical protein FOIG_00944 [Fusarium odoratissimum NRRL 54006]|uniref:Uncharacterized protein n=1 Tax=Fusarium odoratissimum (strain NRRL 54006) TaxID=1089451 RepID=X0KR19_FUSO5|nr:uncharacterized protein FOIG_00944 [Fusarium odoratissimum NRRL 54006]EXM11136.1 hypothetical protein FOIG_00944 [Fusarium odoratissimum NRRL 54006]